MGRIVRMLRGSWTSSINLLTGLTPRTWLGLLVMATFVSAGARFNYTIMTSYLPLSAESSGAVLDPISIGLDALLGVTSLFSVVILGFYLIGSIMDFVFTHYLLTRKTSSKTFMVAARRYGSHLFIIRLGLLTGFILAFSFQYTIFQLIDFYPIAIVLVVTNTFAVVIYTILNGYITDFIVPLVLENDGSFAMATRELISYIRSDPQAFAFYTIVRASFNIIVAIGTILVGSIIVILAGIPLPAMVADLFAITDPSGLIPTLVTWTGTMTALLLSMMISFLVFVQLPVKVFLRYLPLQFLVTFDQEYEDR